MLEKKLSRQLGLPEVEILDLKNGPRGILLIAQKTRGPCEICPKCANPSSSVYDHREISVKDEPMRQTKVTLKLRKRRYYCHHCRKPFTEYVPGIWPKRRTTQRLREAVMHACNNFSNMSKVCKIFAKDPLENAFLEKRNRAFVKASAICKADTK